MVKYIGPSSEGMLALKSRFQCEDGPGRQLHLHVIGCLSSTGGWTVDFQTTQLAMQSAHSAKNPCHACILVLQYAALLIIMYRSIYSTSKPYLAFVR